VTISRVREEDLEDLLPLMRGYSDFYEVDPPDERLLWLSRELLANPEHDGVQLIARIPAPAARSGSRRSTGRSPPRRRPGSRS
jgi:hypothetical protein